MKTEKYYLDDIFLKPEDKNCRVWRYMDLIKFISLLDSGALYFTRFDKFEDSLEGYIPLKNRQAIIGKNDPNIYENMFSNIKSFNRCHYFNCWHINEFESYLMWKSYTDKKTGIAIKSTYSKLKSSFNTAPEIKFGIVKYQDNIKTPIQNRDGEDDNIHIYYPLFTKNSSYSSEKELRLMHQAKDDSNSSCHDVFTPKYEHGVLINVNLSTLIESVVISPFSDPLLINALENTIAKFGYTFDVHKSEIQIRG